MKITFVGHASILIEAGGVTILSDPWWRGPCFGAQWWIYPTPYLDILAGKRIDFVYISHGHHDHFHPGTLSTLSRDFKVIISRQSQLAPSIADLGFECIELDDDEEFSLGPEKVTCRIIGTYSDDTLMVVSDGNEVCLNLNDSLHSAPEAIKSAFTAKLTKIYPTIDYVFCGYGTASHFPNCYVIPGKNRQATAALRQRHFNLQWAKLIEGFQPRFGFPFAADVVFLEDDLFWANEPIHNSERPTAAFRNLYPKSKVVTLDIAPGFEVQDGRVVKENLRGQVHESDLKTIYADQILRTNRYGSVDEAAVKEVAALLQHSIELCSDYMKSYDGNYRFLLQFRGSQFSILIEKVRRDIRLKTIGAESRAGIDYDVSYTTRLAYLKRSLTESHGDEILFVGSGGIFEYTDPSKAKLNLHRELQLLLRKREAAPRPRYGTSSKYVHKAKQVIKKLIGRSNQDLYDLSTWTVFNKDRA